jgi:hypothetical protein
MDIPITRITDHSLSWFGTDTSLKSAGVNLKFNRTYGIRTC